LKLIAKIQTYVLFYKFKKKFLIYKFVQIFQLKSPTPLVSELMKENTSLSMANKDSTVNSLLVSQNQNDGRKSTYFNRKNIRQIIFEYVKIEGQKQSGTLALHQLENLTDKTSSELFEEHTDFYIRQLGSFALETLNRGDPVQDEVLVHIIAEKIRGLPNTHGWIIDGFPNTYKQAKLLEKALTGYNEDKPEPDKPKKESVLAPNPKPEPPKPKHQSGIDLVVYFDLSNEVALQRSIGRFGKYFLSGGFKHRFNL
jgi:adenylate kinase family enzyme